MAAVQVLHKLVCASFTQTGRPPPCPTQALCKPVPAALSVQVLCADSACMLSLFPSSVKLSQVRLWFVEKDRNHLFICMFVYM